MTSKIALVVFGLLLVTIAIVVQSAPVKPMKEPLQLSKIVAQESVDQTTPSITSTSPTTTASLHSSDASSIQHETNDIKKKRYVDNYDRFNDFIDDESNEDDEYNVENKLHTIINENPTEFDGDTDKSVDTDNTYVFTDSKMDPLEFSNLARKRRNIKLTQGSKQRRKRASSIYDFYNNDPLYESLIERQQFIRPNRAFAPLYWYPPAYERNTRSLSAPYIYESPEWNKIFSDTIENEDDQTPIALNDDDDDDANDGYEYNRYPLFLESPNIPYDNLQLQQQYNVNNLPTYEDNDQDDELVLTPYGPMESYFK
ncbi:unnamed protein product [Rotaria sp. Silwood2]|nr:unnamed protein product [Rotaria sp. Silwood2]CAF2751036.1 unnamed protein product [Rotaria sp. Silwood2]CAF3041462.1 unnamed protein product [Rotaria sp. Silwood2]CAF3185059.1 unnamed protein product [Rotaria sp. Silwood2]CAF4086900.1 unnamed protein product [Rotaria sp. Silwood2]